MRSKAILSVKKETKRKISSRSKKDVLGTQKIKYKVIRPRKIHITVRSITPLTYGVTFEKKTSFFEKIKKANARAFSCAKNQVQTVLNKRKLLVAFIQKNNYANIKKKVLRKKRFYKKVVVLNYVFYQKQILKYLRKQKKKFKKVYYILFPTVSGRRVATAAFLILLLILTTLNVHNANATTYTFTQTSWATDPSPDTALHPGDQSGWNKYSAKDANLAVVNAGAGLALATTAGSVTQTNDGTTSTGFNLSGNTLSNTLVSGTGDNASVKLTSTSTSTNTHNDYTINSSLGASVYDSHTSSLWVLNSAGVTKLNPANGSIIGTYNFPGSGITFDSHTNSIWVANSTNGSVKKINSETGAQIGSYTAGTSPTDVVFDPSTNSIWVANNGSANITKINSENGATVGTYAVANGPRRITFDPSTNSIWVTNYTSNSVSKVSASDGSVTGTYALGFFPRGIAFDSYTNSIWVVNWNDTVTKIKASDGSITGIYSTGGNSGGEAIVFDPITNSVWIGLQRVGYLIKIDVTTGSSSSSHYLPTTSQTAVSFEPITNSVWVSSSGSAVTQISVLSGVISGTYSVGTNPNGAAFDSSTNSLWVTNYGSNSVTKLNPFTGATIGTYAVGTNPLGIVFDSSTNSIWVANSGSNSVSKINPATGATISTSVVTSPQRLAFDSSTNSVWVVSSGTVTKLQASDGASLGTVTVGSGTAHIAFDSYTNSIWVANTGALYKINASTREITSTLAFGSYHGIAFDSYTNSIWVAEYNSGKAKKVNVVDGTYVQYTIGVFYSIGITFDPLTNSVWFADWYYGGTLVRVNASTGIRVGAYPVSVSKLGSVFDSASNSIWFTNGSGISKLNLASVSYSSSGTYTSGVIDLNSEVASFSTLSFTSSVPSNTTLSADIRAGNSSNTNDGTWTGWATGVVSGGSIASLGSHRYVQYRANLASSDSIFTPTLNDITINYNTYPASQTLTSSAYNTNSDKNLMGGLNWNENAALPAGSGVTFSLRTASTSEGLNSADWYDFTNATSHCTKVDTLVSCPNTAIPVQLKSGNNDQWWQYKITLSSSGASTATVSGVEVRYVVNSPPELANVTASQGSDGLISISYDVRDLDTFAEGNNTPGKVTPSFEYWNGTTWVTATTLSSGATSNQDVTEEYSTHTLTWNPKIDFNGHYMTDAKIRVRVNDNELANGITTSESDIFTLDTTDPVVDTFVLDARSDATNNISISVTEDTMSELKMKLSNNSDLSADGSNSDSGAWIDYATTKAWNFTSDNPTVYYQFKDKYGNISNGGSTHAVSLPQRPVNVVYQDVSNSETSEWREFIAWGEVAEPTPGFKQYNIYRSTSGTNDGDFTLLDTRDRRDANFILDAELNTEATYSYRVSAEDMAGNISAYSNIVSDRPDGQGGTDLTPPVISLVQVSNITAQSALVTWNTDEPSNSTVSYITDDSGDFTNASNVGVNSMTDYPGRLGQHAVFLNNLSPGVTYYIQVSSADPNTNTAVGGTGVSFTVLSGPVISGVQSLNIQNGGATVTWNTTDASDSHVYYSTDPTFASHLSVDQSESTLSHSIALTGLMSGRTYYYYVKSGVAEDKNIVNGEITYYSFTTSSDSSGPVITFNSGTDITEKTETSVRISWITSELSTSELDYGADDGDPETPPVYDQTLTNENFNTNHSYSLTGLTKGTLYNFRLKNTDANGNPSLLTDLTFSTLDLSDTTPPEISNVAALQVLDTSATITWTTDEPANSFVNYGTVSGTYNTTANNATYDYSHSVVLSGLTIKTQYFLKVTSIDSNGNSTTSETEISFTTSDTLTAGGSGGGSITIPIQDLSAPIIGNVLVKNITANQVTIEWGTNKNADSAVEFGPTTSYGLASINRMPTMNHSQVLINLFPGTPYNYKITSIDTSGNLSAPYTGTFTTTALSEIPKIETTPANPEEQAKNDAKFADVLRNAFDFIKQASKTVSLSALESSLEEQQNNIRELSDLTPNPKIISGPEIKAWEDMVSISWTTDKKTNSLIAYSEEGTPLTDTEKTQVIGNPGIYSLDHQVIISGLKPDTTYNYQIRGATVIGSSVVFPPDTFTTLAKSAKVDNYVADRLSDDTASFKWSSSVPTNTSVRITPYRNNALSYDEARVLNDQNQTSIHQMTVDNLEPGVFYKIDLFGTDNSGRTLSQSIEAFSTSSKELPFMIEQVKTSSALAPGESLQVQSIISWNTTKLSTSKVYYRKGTSKDDNNWPLESNLDTGYTRHHLVVMTDFDPGEVYQFQVESSDSNGERVRSKTYTILTPRQKESVFQVIFKNVEQTFGWMGGNGD